MQGKLISFVPKMNGNVQETYNGKNGTLYKFTVTFDVNGTSEVGTASSNKPNPSWKVNEEYTFEKTITGNNGQFVNFNQMKSVNGGSFGGGGSKKNPSFVIQKCFEAAGELTVRFFKQYPSNYSPQAEQQILDKFWNSLLAGDEDTRWRNIYSFRLTMDKLETGLWKPAEGEKVSEYIWKSAKHISDSMKAAIDHQLNIDKQNGK